MPLYARKTYAQIVAGTQIVVETLCYGFARDGKFGCPTLVFVLGVVERALHLGFNLKSRAVPLKLHESGCRSAIWLLYGEVEDGAYGVYFYFEVVVSIAIGVDKYLEVVVVVHHFVVILDVGPNVRFTHFGCHIQVIVVPHHLGASLVARFWIAFAADVDKCLDFFGFLPRFFVYFAVNLYLTVGAIAHIVVGDGKKTGILLSDRLRPSAHGEYGT